ncbi:MAG: hypothetical protein ABF975_01250 [Liquorilactobacillus hordei]|uniref:hypothetical protein n=1 Tax=Liquorilactobacillus hordei TaxID=468911 RepID=UPI0039EC31FF
MQYWHHCAPILSELMKERREENDWRNSRSIVQIFMVDVSRRHFGAVFISICELVCEIKKEHTAICSIRNKFQVNYSTDKECKYE